MMKKEMKKSDLVQEKQGNDFWMHSFCKKKISLQETISKENENAKFNKKLIK